LRNLQCDEHRDKGDMKDGWVVEVLAGDFKGGALAFPELGVRLHLEPGDVVFFRSTVLKHYVEDFDGERAVLVFFTHQNVFEAHQRDLQEGE